MTRAQFRSEAEADLNEAVTWYESQRAGLGVDFLDEVERIAARINSSPLQFPVVYRDAHRALLRRFPFAVFFRVTDEKTLIVAVADLRRNATRWQRRL